LSGDQLVDAGETPPFEQAHFDAWLDNTQPAQVGGGLANTPGGYVAFEHRAAPAPGDGCGRRRHEVQRFLQFVSPTGTYDVRFRSLG